MIMPNTNEVGALAVAERICARIRELKLPHAHSDVADHVTVSIGTASMVPQSDRLCTELVSTADTALYAAKHSGRNRVAISGNAAGNEQRATA